MKIAIVTPGFLPVPAIKGGAVEVLINELIDGNEEAQTFNIDLYTLKDKKIVDYTYNLTNLIEIHPNMYTIIKCKIKNFLRKVLKTNTIYYRYNEEVINKIKKKHYDYIIIENNTSLYRDIYNRTQHKENLIFHVHNDMLLDDKPDGLLVLNTAYKIITVSEFLKRKIQQIKLIDNIHVLYNCINLDKYNKSINRDVSKYYSDYNIQKNDIIVMYAGRINSEKGVLELVKAFKSMDVSENIKLIVVGSSWFDIVEKDDYVNAIIEESESVKDRIIFTGYIYPNEMPDILSIADIGVVPSLCEEAFGVIALEMMSMEIPLITTVSGGLPEVVDETCAFQVIRDENLIYNIANRLNELVRDTNLRKNMGRNGKIRVENTLSFHNTNYFSNFVKILKNNI